MSKVQHLDALALRTTVTLVMRKPDGMFERLAWAMERGFTCNFATIARVRGALRIEDVERALTYLQKRHPNLRRSPQGGEASEIPLRYVDAASLDEWIPHAEEELMHGTWEEATSPARCRVLRHTDDLHTFVFTLWHPVSDGKSGMFAVRDLIENIDSGTNDCESISAQPLEAYLPEGATKKAVSKYLALTKKITKNQSGPQLGNDTPRDPMKRHSQIVHLEVGVDKVQQLATKAKQAGVSLHAAITALVGTVVGENIDSPRNRLQVTHPVDMRNYLQSKYPETIRGKIPETVGYFVSFLDTMGAYPADDFTSAAQSVHALAFGNKAEFHDVCDQQFGCSKLDGHPLEFE